MSSNTITLAKRANPARARTKGASGQHPDAYETLRAALGDRFAPRTPAEDRFITETARKSWRIQPVTRTKPD